MAPIDGLESEGKHANARLQLAYLRKFFNWCAERDLLSDVPTHRIRLNGTVNARERSLSHRGTAPGLECCRHHPFTVRSRG